ncbi:uncharacterized protein [Anabrus simplex]|uniref:uncharacterized protein isoform X4 n=1 Tax=Anabrus simplex TaxID=316456 RepID=UPI0034DD57B3
MPQTEVILSTHDVTTSADKRRNQNVTMTLELPTEEQLARIYDELAMNPDTIERDVAYLKEWISKQPHLPNGIDDRFLRNSLIFRKNSLEKVKESVDLFYSVKSLAPELLSNRDPFDPALQGEMENLFFYPLPKLTQDGSRVIISKLFCTDPKMFYYPSAAKLVLMVAAVSLLEDRCLSHTIVFDLQGITMSHLATVQIPLARKFIYIGQVLLSAAQAHTRWQQSAQIQAVLHRPQSVPLPIRSQTSPHGGCCELAGGPLFEPHYSL